MQVLEAAVLPACWSRSLGRGSCQMIDNSGELRLQVTIVTQRLSQAVPRLVLTRQLAACQYSMRCYAEKARCV